MEDKNRKKLAGIKAKIFNVMATTMGSKYKEDKEFEEALKLLGDAMNKVEKWYGDVD